MASIKNKQVSLTELASPSLEDRIKAMEDIIARSQEVIEQQNEVIGSLTAQVKGAGVTVVTRGKVDTLKYVPEVIDRDHIIGEKGSSNVYVTSDIKQAIAYAKDTPNIVIAMIDLDLCYQSIDHKTKEFKGYPAVKDMKFFHTATTHGYTDYFPVTLNTGEKADLSFSLNAQLRPSKPIEITGKVIL